MKICGRLIFSKEAQKMNGDFAREGCMERNVRKGFRLGRLRKLFVSFVGLIKIYNNLI